MVMTVAQTTQLIQLILNSTLMLAIALAWWGVVWLRHSALTGQLQRRPAPNGGAASLPPLQRRQTQTRCRLMRSSALVMHTVLLLLTASLFCLAWRTLVGADWLVPLALVLFVAGSGGLLLSIGLALLEFCQIERLSRPSRRRSARPQPALPPGRSPAAAALNQPLSERVAS
jgi:hypothetical protein